MLEIIDLSGIATFQDSGRRGWNKFGVPTSGPMDWFAYQAANSLLDNPKNSATIELGLGESHFALCEIRRSPSPAQATKWKTTFGHSRSGRSFYVRAGWTVRVKKTSGGNWAYIAIAGGFDSPVIMNSRSAYLRGGIGSAIKAGDVLHSGKPANELLKLAARDFPVNKFMNYSQTPTIEVIPAPQADWFTKEGIRTFYESEYTLSPSFDRMGYRLQGLIEKAVTKELISEGMTMGSIQIPADGQPIVMMADAPTTGGYPKIANVTRASLPLLAQCEAGVSKIRFRETTVEDAQEKYHVLARADG
jgi:antagonist of KipI